MSRAFESRSIAFRERQRQESLTKLRPIRTDIKKEKEPIIARPFDGIKEIKLINLPDYRNLSNYIQKIISPSENIKRTIVGFMVNMFLNLPDNFYRPGKEYSREEREFTKKQLEVFLESLSGLEFIFGYEAGSLGNFKDKKRYHLKEKDIAKQHLTGFLDRDLWNMGRDYHIVYLKNPSAIVPNEYEAECIAEAIVHNRNLEEGVGYQSLISQKDNEVLCSKLESFLIKQGIDMEKVGRERLSILCEQYINENQHLSAKQKEFIKKIPELTEFMTRFEKEVKEEVKKLPTEKEIITKLYPAIKDNGILILESSKVKDIPSLKLVDSYSDVSLYQKIF